MIKVKWKKSLSTFKNKILKFSQQNVGRGRFLLQPDNPLRQAEVRLLGQRPQRPRRMLPLTHSGKLFNRSIYYVYYTGGPCCSRFRLFADQKIGRVPNMREISQNKTKAWVFILAGLQERNNNNQRDPKIVVVGLWSYEIENGLFVWMIHNFTPGPLYKPHLPQILTVFYYKKTEETLLVSLKI